VESDDFDRPLVTHLQAREPANRLVIERVSAIDRELRLFVKRELVI